MFVRHPVWLQKATRPGAESFALVFAAESLARSLISSVIPLQMLRVLGDAQQVSTLYFLASSCGLLYAILLPMIVGRIPRRFVYSFGAVVMGAASLLFMGAEAEYQLLAMLARVVGLVTTTVCMNLYILDHISRRELSRSEPKRVFYSAWAWTIGPVTGAFLLQYSDWLPFAVSAVCVVVMIVYFWCLRLSQTSPIMPGRGRAQNPLRNIRRFVKQPRLILAWTLAFCRASWWSMFFIYTPLFAVHFGLGELAGGILVSLGNGFLFLLPFWARIARRIGARLVLRTAFLVSGVGTSLVAFTAGLPELGAGCILLAAIGMSFQDSIGNLPFMVAVRPSERAEMTSVYTTYRDTSELVPPGVFSVLLRFYDLTAVFLVMGGLMFAVAGLTRKVHPRIGKDRHSVEERRPALAR